MNAEREVARPRPHLKLILVAAVTLVLEPRRLSLATCEFSLPLVLFNHLPQLPIVGSLHLGAVNIEVDLGVQGLGFRV